MPRPQRMHAHSLEGHREEQPTFAPRLSAILAVYAQHGRLTDRDVMRRLGYTDPNSVRPRVTEAIKAGLLEEIGLTEDRVTGKTVRVCAIAAPRAAEQLALL